MTAGRVGGEGEALPGLKRRAQRLWSILCADPLLFLQGRVQNRVILLLRVTD